MVDLFLRRVLNPAAFALRETLAFRRAGYREGPLDLGRVSARLREQLAGPRARKLAAWSGLEIFAPHLGHAAYTKSLFACDVLERLHTRAPLCLPVPEVLDVGSKNFEAAPGLYGAACRIAGRDVRLTGSEIDAYPVYRNLHSRADAAEYYLRLLPGAHRFVPGDVRGVGGRIGLITWFFPFLTPAPLLWWGLPERFFMPEALFKHVTDLLAPDGTLVVANYTPAEAEIQARLFVQAGIPVRQEVMDDLIGRQGQSVYVFVTRP